MDWIIKLMKMRGNNGRLPHFTASLTVPSQSKGGSDWFDSEVVYKG